MSVTGAEFPLRQRFYAISSSRWSHEVSRNQARHFSMQGMDGWLPGFQRTLEETFTLILMILNSTVRVLILVSGAALLVASATFRHLASPWGAVGQTSGGNRAQLGSETEGSDGKNGNQESAEGRSFARGAIAGVLPSSAGVGEGSPRVASIQASPSDREFAALLETLHKGSRQARAGRSLWRAIGDSLNLSAGRTDQLGEQTLLDPEFGEFSLSVATRLGLSHGTPAPGRGNERAADAVLRDFEVNLLAAMERTATADLQGTDYARAPIGISTTWSDAGSLVDSGASSGSATAPETFTGTVGPTPSAADWSGTVPAPLTAGNPGWNSNSGSSPLTSTGSAPPSLPTVWNHFTAPTAPVSRHTVAYHWNSSSSPALSTAPPAVSTAAASANPVVSSAAVSGSSSSSSGQVKSAALVTAPVTSGGTSLNPATSGVVTTYSTSTAFAGVTTGNTSYNFPTPTTASDSETSPYTVGPLAFSNGEILFLENDGSYGAGQIYLDSFPNPSVSISLTGATALSFTLGTFDNASPISVTVNGSSVTGFSTAGGAPGSTFYGLRDTVPITSITFTATSDGEIDILNFQTASLPEPGSVVLLMAGGLGLLLRRRRRAVGK